MSRISIILRKIGRLESNNDLQSQNNKGSVWWCNDTYYFKAHPERPVLLFSKKKNKCNQLVFSHEKHGSNNTQIAINLSKYNSNVEYKGISWLNIRRKFKYNFKIFREHQIRYLCNLYNDDFEKIQHKFKEYHKIV